MKKRVTITVCDICQREDLATKPYRIALPDQRLRTIDLCDQHAEPVVKVAKESESARTRTT